MRQPVAPPRAIARKSRAFWFPPRSPRPPASSAPVSPGVSCGSPAHSALARPASSAHLGVPVAPLCRVSAEFAWSRAWSFATCSFAPACVSRSLARQCSAMQSLGASPSSVWRYDPVQCSHEQAHFPRRPSALTGIGVRSICSSRTNLTRRSSGPRGESIVFPDTLSARGRLTRR
jgi:hypothetical protein